MGGTVIETESERLIRNGKTLEKISDFCGYELSYVRQVEESMRQTAGKDSYMI
jgi:hypothetical protein